MTSDLETWRLVALALLGLLGGVGITALGPGGVLPTIGLFTLTDLAPPEVAGTSIVTHLGTGILATAAYTRSGQLRMPQTRKTAGILAVAALVGTPLGVFVNSGVSTGAFGLVLGTFAALVAVLVWLRGRTDTAGREAVAPSAPVLAALGVAVATAAGIVGIGGPMLMVPVLVVMGLPVLSSLAAAQVQSVVIAAVGTVGYLASGAVDWPLAVLVGVPELAGVVVGWRIAHALPTRILTRALIVALLAVAPYLALHG